MIYFVILCHWADKNTKGLNYYGRTLDERRRFKRALSFRAMFVMPLLWLLGRLSQVKLDQASFVYENVAGPKDSCSEESFRLASSYRPNGLDVFVATQMKCGTTWMQHLVLQILTRGGGDLAETGRALYAASPWIEGVKSVSMEDAPLIGSAQPRRVIKTHLPTSLCPFNEQAKYVYVVRHPLSCFASTVDFIRMNLGPLNLSIDSFEQWFCSNQMWWGSWPEHVRGWWQWSQERSNVLFVRFEDMKSDLGNVTRQVAEFLEIEDLSENELRDIEQKCSFEYMSGHAESFEMNVPTVLQSSASPFVSGKIDRYGNVPIATRQRLLDWCRASLEGTGTNLEELYPDLEARALSTNGSN